MRRCASSGGNIAAKRRMAREVDGPVFLRRICGCIAVSWQTRDRVRKSIKRKQVSVGSKCHGFRLFILHLNPTLDRVRLIDLLKPRHRGQRDKDKAEGHFRNTGRRRSAAACRSPAVDSACRMGAATGRSGFEGRFESECSFSFAVSSAAPHHAKQASPNPGRRQAAALRASAPKRNPPSSLDTVEYLRARAERADLKDFDRVLKMVPSGPPDPGDELPPNYKRPRR